LSKITSQIWAPCWPIFFFRLADDDPGRVCGHDEGGNARRSLLRWIAARHQREHAGAVSIGDEALGAVHDIGIAITDGADFDRSGVGTGARFCQREAGDDLATRQLRQPFGLLFVTAEHDDTLAADADIGAYHGTEGRGGLAQLDGDQHLLLHGQAEAAIFFRDGNTEEPEFAHLGHNGIGHAVVVGDFCLDRHAFLRHETANGFNQLLAGFGIERHGLTLG